MEPLMVCALEVACCDRSQPTCRDQNHGGEEAHLLLAEAQVGELLAEVKHGVEKVPGPHGPQRVHAVFLPAQEGDGALLDVEERSKADHQHLQSANTQLRQSGYSYLV